MHGPLVSILMPAFNNASTISAALLSTVNQSHRTLEIVIIDDGSTDQTEAAVFSFNDPRIIYEKIDKNIGIAGALNRGLKLARGDIIARMDADDMMRPQRISDQVTFMLERGVSILGGAAEKFGMQTGLMVPPETGADIINGFLINNPFIHPTIMVNRRGLPEDFLYNEAFECEEDYEIWSRLITERNCNNIGYPLIKYRVSSVSNQDRIGKRALTGIALRQFCARFNVHDAPIECLVNVQLSKMIRHEDYLSLRDYAERVQKTDKPKLGWLQQSLCKSRSYRSFMNWYHRRTGQSKYQV